MGYSRQEQETSVVWDELEKVAHIYSASPSTMLKLDRLAAQFPDVYKRIWTEETGGRITAAKYEVAVRYVRFGKPASAAQIEARRINAAKINSAVK